MGRQKFLENKRKVLGRWEDKRFEKMREKL